MRWVTRKRVQVNRTATAWLVQRFIDPNAEFLFVDPQDVEGVQREQKAIGFDAPGATYPHRDEKGRCSFEALVDEHVGGDPALRALASIVHGADFAAEVQSTPESAGLRAISAGFPLVSKGDADTIARAAFLYDALYASLQARLRPPVF
jgi:hypothetical protein